MPKDRVDNGSRRSLDGILITGELDRRPRRAADYEAEVRALGELATEFTIEAEGRLQKVIEAARVLCRADSAGVSILESDPDSGDVFRWHAIGGPFAANANRTLPRESPCGAVVDRNEVLLFDRPERAFPSLAGIRPVIHEALLAPWPVAGEPRGALWVMDHGSKRHFDAEDARILSTLARFAAAAWRARLAFESSRTRDAIGRLDEQRHRMVLANARDYAIITADPDGVVESWSPGAEAVFGWSAIEMIGKPMALTFTPEDCEGGQPARERAVALERDMAPDVRWHVRKDGRRVFIDGTTRPMRGEVGELLGFLKIGQDITQRRQAEQTLHESEARYRALVESVRDYAIFLLDPRGIIVEWPKSAEHVKGYTAAEVMGRHVSIFYMAEDVARGLPELELAEAAESGRSERQGWRLRKSGDRFWAEESVTPIHDAEGALLGYTRICRDLTERHRAAETAERVRTSANLDLLRGRLALAEEEERSRLARELHDGAGQYLTALGLGLQALSDIALPGSDVDRRVEQLRSLTDRLGSELHGIAVRLRPKALDDFGLEAALTGYAQEWAQRFGIRVDMHANLGTGRLPAVMENALYRIVQEALTNIAKHSGATRAAVMVERRGGQVHTIVEDDGKGFDADAPRQPDGKGGLGLSGIRERAELLGGVVEVESVPGKGTTLFVHFAVEDAALRRHDGADDDPRGYAGTDPTGADRHVEGRR